MAYRGGHVRTRRNRSRGDSWWLLQSACRTLCQGLLLAVWSVLAAADLLSILSSGRAAVETSLGTVIGKSDASGQSFLGIPFGKPPVGEGRWRAPEPVEPWGRLEALQFGAECMQNAAIDEGPPQKMSEDCLFLNVWTPPNAKRGSHYPVMVWIFGGGFQQGSSSQPIYHGNHLAKRDVVVVSLNYRVGAFGFMVSVHDGLWGNYGLQDQRLALQWVHDHIADFGGDPDCVTIFGESAGAMSAGLHMHMDGAGRLFHGVIMQSNPLGYKFRSITVANFLGQAIKRGLDCTDLQCMRSEPAADILKQQEMLLGVPRSVGDFFTWGPVMTDSIHRNVMRWHSKKSQGKVPVMNVTQPLTTWGFHTGGSHVDLPVLMGANKHEGQMFVHGAFPVNMPKYVYWGFVVALFKDSAPRVLREYGALAQKCKGSGDYRPVMSEIIHDYLFRCPLQRTAHLLQDRREHLGGGVAPPVFVYEFSHPTMVPGFPACNGLSCHTAELPFVFEQLEEIRADYSFATFLARNGTEGSARPGILFPGRLDADTKVSRAMAAYWTDFAKFGDPNQSRGQKHWPDWRGRRRWPTRATAGAGGTCSADGGDGTCAQPLNWQLSGTEAPQQPGYIEISETLTLHTATRDCACQFWDQLQWRY